MEHKEGDRLNPAPHEPAANMSASNDSGGAFPPDDPDAPVPESRNLLGQLLVLAIIGSLVWLVLFYLQPDNVLKVLLGLSFVIFIHELGHFVVAKLCDVHVTHFSIGFGPKIPFCWFKYGETTYQFCLIPLGGYVQMVGQVDGDESSDGSEDDPRSYRAKSVGQRMAIISAGVVMNAITALICFIIVFRGPGKDRLAPVIYQVDSGGPAFVEGLRTGAVIEKIGDIDHPYFDDLKTTVAGSNYGEVIHLVTKRPQDAKAQDIEIEPRKTRDDPNPVIGITTPTRLKLASKRDLWPILKTPVRTGTPAAEGAVVVKGEGPAFQFDDEIVAMSDVDSPAQLSPLPVDPRKEGQCDFFEFNRRLQLLAGKDVLLRLRRTFEGDESIVDVKVPAAFRVSFGARMEMGQIVAVRKGSPAARHDIRTPDSNKRLWGDLILKVEVPEADGKTTVFEGATLDPERLPLELRAWAARLDAVAQPKKAPKAEVTLHLRRHRQGAGEQFETVKETLDWDRDWQFDRAVPITLASPLAIPELGLGYQVKTTVAGVDKDAALQPGDVIKNLKLTVIDLTGKEKTSGWLADEKDLGPEEWAHASYLQFQMSAHKILKIVFKVERSKEEKEIEITPTVDTTWPILDRGWQLSQDLRRQKASNILDAVALGLQDTHKSMVQILQNLRQMIVGRISWKKNLGGPISIARFAYSIAGYDIWEFVFFLGLISINLAVINFLPIPVLDGGHMVFLIYEKLRGKPASDAVRAGATYAGLAFILGLMGLVLWLDIGRFFLS